MPTDLTTAAQKLRRSKDRWGSYAVDHDAIDALADLLEAIHHARGRIARTALPVLGSADAFAALTGGNDAHA